MVGITICCRGIKITVLGETVKKNEGGYLTE
nr:MAG TPA: hypothetical protein [Caudoviricetes sp.]